MESIRNDAAATINEARRSAWQAVTLESAVPGQLAQLAAEYPRLLLEPRGDGHDVVVLPGYGASDKSTDSLRQYLRLLGYNAHGWGLGFNSGDVMGLTEKVKVVVHRLHSSNGKQVSLIGWSLGGVIAREVARYKPEHVRRVITMGSPITGGAKYTVIANQMAKEGVDLDELERHWYLWQSASQPIRTPVTAVFSRLDGIVAWQACIDRINLHVEHVEVKSSHFGLIIDPAVYRIIARRLAGPG